MSYNHYNNKIFGNISDTKDSKHAVLKFTFVDDKYPIYKLSKDDLKAFINFAKRFENLPWGLIKNYIGFKFENIPNLKVPNNTLDENICSLRVSQKFRLIGFRKENAFNIIWFDKNHEVY